MTSGMSGRIYSFYENKFTSCVFLNQTKMMLFYILHIAKKIKNKINKYKIKLLVILFIIKMIARTKLVDIK